MRRSALAFKQNLKQLYHDRCALSTSARNLQYKKGPRRWLLTQPSAILGHERQRSRALVISYITSGFVAAKRHLAAQNLSIFSWSEERAIDDSSGPCLTQLEAFSGGTTHVYAAAAGPKWEVKL